MIDPELNYFVNLQTYPIDRLGSEAGQNLLKPGASDDERGHAR